MSKTKNKNKVPVIIAVVLALFLPTYAAVISYFALLNQPALMSSGNFSISIIQPDGSDLKIEKSDSAEMINLFRAIRRDAVSVGEADISDCSAYNVTLSDGKAIDTLCCLFSPSGKGYIRDGTAGLLEIPQRYTDIFLSGGYAYMLFGNSVMPVMMFSGFSVVPESAEWSYSGYKGKRTYCNVAVTDRVLNYGNTSTPSISFSTAPLNCTVTVYDGNDKLFEGSLGAFASLSDQLTGSYSYNVKAQWQNGSAEYGFTSSPVGKASFTLVSAPKESGGYAVISGTGVLDPDAVSVSVSPSTGAQVRFFRNGDAVCALVPFGLDIFDFSDGSGESREYTVTVSYGGESSVFRVILSEPVYQEKELRYSGTASMSTQNIEASKSLISSVCAVNEQNVRLSGSFLDYESQGFTYSPGFGRVRLLSDSSKLLQQGVQYRSEKSGASVPAANAGEVVKVGSDALLGNYVVIDHGLGVKTWYCHLSSYVVAARQSVTKGQTVGRTGSSGYADTNGFFLITTVNGVPVSPYTMQESGIPTVKSGG